MSPAPIQERLRKLWRAVDAEGGAARTEFDSGYNQAIGVACDRLNDAGFSEGRSEAADLMDEMLAALRLAHDHLDRHGNGWDEADALSAIRAAIAKATGPQPSLQRRRRIEGCSACAADGDRGPSHDASSNC